MTFAGRRAGRIGAAVFLWYMSAPPLAGKSKLIKFLPGFPLAVRREDKGAGSVVDLDMALPVFKNVFHGVSPFP